MKVSFAGAAVLAIFLAGCGSKFDGNEKNFGAAIDRYLATRWAPCISVREWPMEISESNLRVDYVLRKQMAALEAVGLVQGQDVAVANENWSSVTDSFQVRGSGRRFSLTSAAMPYVRPMEGGKDVLCWGRRSLDKVVKWEGPWKFGDAPTAQDARVTFRYTLQEVADWSRRPEIQAVFPEIAQTLQGAQKPERRAMLRTTSEGWEVAFIQGW